MGLPPGRPAERTALRPEPMAEYTVETGKGVVVRGITTERVQDLMCRGREIMLQEYEPRTRNAQLRVLERWRSWSDTAKEAVPNATETDVLAGFVEYVRTEGAREIKYNSVSWNLSMLSAALPVYLGTELPAKAVRALHRGLAKNHLPNVRANPLSYRSLMGLLRSQHLGHGAKALASVLWLSTQRGDTVLDVMGAEIFLTHSRARGDEEDVATVYFLARRKNKQVIERVDPICQQWVLGDLAEWIVPYLKSHVGMWENTPLFTRSQATELERFLATMKVEQRHPYLKDHYTLYSLKRGALQQLGHLEDDWNRIQAISLHRRLAGLSCYIGAFLNPRVRQSRDMTRLLSRAPATAVPPERVPIPRSQRGPIGVQPENRKTRSRSAEVVRREDPEDVVNEMLDLDFMDNDVPKALMQLEGRRRVPFTSDESRKIEAAPMMVRRSGKQN